MKQKKIYEKVAKFPKISGNKTLTKEELLLLLTFLKVKQGDYPHSSDSYKGCT